MKVISLKNIDDFYSAGQIQLLLEPSQVITPSAKDYLKSKGVKLVYSRDGKKESNDKKSFSSLNTSDSENSKKDVVERIVNLLVSEYGIKDSSLISKIVLDVMKEINN